MTEQSKPQQLFLVTRRFIVVLLYILVTIAVLWWVAKVSSSTPCYQSDRCDKYDQIFFAVMGLADFVMAFVWIILGFKGKLPGTRAG